MSEGKPRGSGNGRPPKPTALAVRAENIPVQLRPRAQWVCWRWAWKADKSKWDKPPLNPRDLSPASPTDRQTWGTFEEALGRYQAGEVDGIGFALLEEDGIVGIDLDKCRDSKTGALAAWADGWIKHLQTYTELSPSATGARLFAFGKLPSEGRKRGPTEMYQHARYLTITGQHLDGFPTEIEKRQTELLDLHRHTWPEHHQQPAADDSAIDIDDAEILKRIERSKQGVLFRKLYDGGQDGYPSPSEADAAFCGIVGWWVKWERERIDRIWKSSPRMREKANREDYRRRTIAFVCDGKSGGYDPNRNGHHAGNGQAPALGTPCGEAKDGLAIILNDFRERYEPRFRRGTAIYSAKLKREVKPGEACFAADKALLAKLAKATNRPCDKHGHVDESALPRFFWNWCKSAWQELLGELSEEEETAEVCESAEEAFRRQVAACLHTQATFTTKNSERGEQTPERRTLLQWCDLWAKGGRWKQVRSALLWCCRDEQDRLRVALRVGLFDQYGPRSLAEMSQGRLSSLCQQYGVGQPEDADGERIRAGGHPVVELSEEFLAELRTAPKGAIVDT